MSAFADASCVLKVNVHCEACKMKMLEVLSSVIGVYSVDIKAGEGLAEVRGEVDPNMLLKALARTGMHAEIVWASLKHPMMSNNLYHHHQSRSSFHCPPFFHPHYNYNNTSSRAFPHNPYPIRGTMPCGASGAGSSYGPFNSCYGPGYMPSSSSNSYYYPYYAADDHRHLGNNCNIM